MKHYFLICLFYFACCSFSFSQNKSIYFPGSENARATGITKSGNGYLISAVSRNVIPKKNCVQLFEISENGAVNWVVNYDSEYTMEAFDVGYSSNDKIGLTGYVWVHYYMQNSFFFTLDNSGNLENHEYISDEMSGIGFSINSDNDGGFSFSGYMANSNILGGQAFLRKVDENGNLLWQKKYGSTDEEQIFSHIQLNDGGYLLVGSLNGFLFNFVWREFSYPHSNMFLLKTNASGDSIWSKTIPGLYNNVLSSVVQSSDESIYILGSTQNQGAGSFDMYFAKINETGEIVWDKTYGGADYEYGYDMCLTQDSYLYLCGVSKSYLTNSVDIYIVKTDLDGNTIWEKIIGGVADEYAFGIESTTDGGCIIVGKISELLSDNEDMGFNIMILKLNSDGEEVLEFNNRENFKLSSVTVSPNPAIDIIEINIDNLNDYNNSFAILRGINGQIIYKQKINVSTTYLNIEGIVRGLYLLEVVLNNTEKHIFKVILQ